MVFKFATFHPAQDPDNFNPAFAPTPSSSPSKSLSQPCEAAFNCAAVSPPMNFLDFNVPKLNDDNYKVWKELILLQLGYMDIDYAIRKDEPPTPTDASTPAEVARYEQWERSNRLSVMFIRTKLSDGICGSVAQHNNAKALLDAIDARFENSEKAHAMTLIMKFSSLKLIGVRSVHEHIMKMRDIVAQLSNLEVEISESFLVYYILNTLPQQYAPFKISYNTHKNKWSINELMTMCVQEEERLLKESRESAHLATQEKYKEQGKQKGKGKIPPQADIKKESKCFFCKRKGHMKKDCVKFEAWLEKKGFSKLPETGGK